MRSAAGFQLVTMPFKSLVTMASFEESTIAASLRESASVRRESLRRSFKCLCLLLPLGDADREAHERGRKLSAQDQEYLSQGQQFTPKRPDLPRSLLITALIIRNTFVDFYLWLCDLSVPNRRMAIKTSLGFAAVRPVDHVSLPYVEIVAEGGISDCCGSHTAAFR